MGKELDITLVLGGEDGPWGEVTPVPEGTKPKERSGFTSHTADVAVNRPPSEPAPKPTPEEIEAAEYTRLETAVSALIYDGNM